MALPSPSSTHRQDTGSGDSHPAEGRSCNGARADVARKMKGVEHMLSNLEEEGLEIDGKIAGIIDDEIARIKAEAEREKLINELKRNGFKVLVTISSVAIGFLIGADCCEQSLYDYAFKRFLNDEL